MLKFKRAVFCYYILRFDRRLHSWLMTIIGSIKTDGFLAIDDADRKRIAQWVSDLFIKKLDFETILHILSGDKFFEQNKTDVAKLEKEAGKRVTELWDTDPIFAKYPNLRTLARNKEFEEKIWPAVKAKMQEHQK
ncbi:MAG: hypothetical protein JW974_01235 [Alphaproteobacteria bacterium]|nr:hypothetical protein [Alphaproteobacteria bacterium]MBN2675411.1 hypothetical protein [Alphaproteobacteria bacterium]